MTTNASTNANIRLLDHNLTTLKARGMVRVPEYFATTFINSETNRYTFGRKAKFPKNKYRRSEYKNGAWGETITHHLMCVNGKEWYAYNPVYKFDTSGKMIKEELGLEANVPDNVDRFIVIEYTHGKDKNGVSSSSLKTAEYIRK